MRKIIWSESGQRDLVRINGWLQRERSAEFAMRTLSEIRFRCKFLTDFPHGGAPLADGLRKLRVPNTGYIIIYMLSHDSTKIVRVFHEHEDWQNQL
jgi:toxin ParE1/3/4